MTATIRERPVKPPARKSTMPPPRGRRRPILTRAETAPCTCPEPCERDHENE